MVLIWNIRKKLHVHKLNENLLVLGVSPEKAPEEGEYVTMAFEKGIPVSVNGKQMKVSDIIRELNRLGGKHGIGGFNNCLGH